MAAPGMLTVDQTQYDVARRRIKQQTDADVQAQRDALQRRAAQTGGGVSGALIKQEQLAQQAGAERAQSGNEGIDAQLGQERQRVAEINTGRQYQTSERVAGQGFTSGEAAKQRRFQTGERVAGQGFASGEASKQRDFASGEALKQRGFATSEREAAQKYGTSERTAAQSYAALQAWRQRNWQSGEADKERTQRLDMFNQQMGFSSQQFEHEKEVDEFNKTLATRIQDYNEKGGFLEQLFSFDKWREPGHQSGSAGFFGGDFGGGGMFGGGGGMFGGGGGGGGGGWF